MRGRAAHTIAREDQLLATLAEHGALTSVELAALYSTGGASERADLLGPNVWPWTITLLMGRLNREGRCGRLDLGREAVWIHLEDG